MLRAFGVLVLVWECDSDSLSWIVLDGNNRLLGGALGRFVQAN